MSCRRICRELLWLARFGELGPSSAPHLEHLSSCRACRDEVGFDRAMVEQLRRALAARIEHASPSPTAWDAILARARTPEPPPARRLWEWSAALVSRLRVATAVAGTGLALVLALNMEIVPAVTEPSDAGTVGELALTQVPRVPPASNSLAALARTWGAGPGSSAVQSDPEAALRVAGRRPATLAVNQAAEEPAAETQVTLRINVRSLQTPEPAPGGAGWGEASINRSTSRIGSEPGEPS